MTVRLAIDGVAPTTNITGGPQSGVVTRETNATFVFTGTDDVTASHQLRFECRLDGASFIACVSPRIYGALAEGEHVFEVRAIDEAGNVDRQSARRTWTIDTTAPTLACAAVPGLIWPPDHTMRAVTLEIAVADRFGPVTVYLRAVASDQPDDPISVGDALGDLSGWELNVDDRAGWVRAERFRFDRTYSFEYEAMDSAGNSAHCGTSIIVPINQSATAQ